MNLTKILQNLVLGLWLVCLVGCSQQSARDVETMQKIANTLSATCAKKLTNSDYSDARNLALITCVFAREFNAVRGKPVLAPTPALGMKKTEPPEKEKTAIVVLGGKVVSCAAVWKEVQEIALQANHEFEGLDTTTYNEFLSSVLSKDEFAKLTEIRTRLGFWPEVQKTVK